MCRRVRTQTKGCPLADRLRPAREHLEHPARVVHAPLTVDCAPAGPRRCAAAADVGRRRVMRPRARSSSPTTVDEAQRHWRGRGWRARAGRLRTAMGCSTGVPGTQRTTCRRLRHRRRAWGRLGDDGSVAPAPGAEHIHMEAARERERQQRGTRDHVSPNRTPYAVFCDMCRVRTSVYVCERRPGMH